MPEDGDPPIARDAYDALADSYAERVDEKPHNRYLEWPATTALLPPVEGRHVLDAGCGPGRYSEWLADRGADVVAFDASERMVEHARERVGDRVTLYRWDIRDPLEFADDASFDLVLSALTLDYVRDWDAVFCEFRRLLTEEGRLVISVAHPLADYIDFDDPDYFETEAVTMTWTGFGEPVEVPTYRRPLAAILNPLVGSGFALERVVEPTPTEEFRERDPERYAELSRRPSFLCLRARAT